MELSGFAGVVERASQSIGSDHPKGWMTAPLRDLFTFGGGLSASRDQLSVDGLAYLHYGDIHLSTKTFIDLDQEHHSIPKLNVPLSAVNSKHLLRDGDVVFVDASEDDDGITKHVAITNCQGRPFISGLHTIVAKPKGTDLDNGFKRYCFQSKQIWQQFRYYAVGTKVTGISKGNIGNVVLCYPPLPEQRAIATALSDVDDLLAGLDALIAKKQALKQGAMQQLLTGQQRLPGFKGEWVVRRLGDVAEVEMGHSPSSAYYNRSGSGIPLVQGNADIENRRTFKRVWTTQITRTCEKGDLILTVRAPVGAVAIASQRSCLGRGVCCPKPKDCSKDFLYHALVYAEPAWQVLEQGSTFTAANSDQVKRFELAFAPTLVEQTAIAEVLSDMDAELAALETRRAKTALLKQGMMQELLTGRTRLV
ncbi:MAG: restriction endonuclease subunit S [Flavobacteriales bacterium]|nr:hypothetical protein [Flavobacteriales bacterium]MCC6577778.1 restriction endonuclease subunit S [Flavobacteriales bacterium]